MSEHYQPVRVFTIEEANAMLPLVRVITSDMVKLANELLDRRQQLATLMSARQNRGNDLYSDELFHIETELEKQTSQLRAYVNELIELGVEPKSGPEGLVDFPAMMDGRLVFLCWKLDEPELMHWHEIDAGFAGRQPLLEGSCVSGNSANSDRNEA